MHKELDHSTEQVEEELDNVETDYEAEGPPTVKNIKAGFFVGRELWINSELNGPRKVKVVAVSYGGEGWESDSITLEYLNGGKFTELAGNIKISK